MKRAERRPWVGDVGAKEQPFNIEFQTLREENRVAQKRRLMLQRKYVLVDEANHVVFVAQNPIVNVQLGQLLLVNAHLIQFLCLEQFRLDLHPRVVLKLIGCNAQRIVIKVFDVDKRQDPIQQLPRFDQPIGRRKEEKHAPE